MACKSFVIVIDTPSIKNYVFGTDPLNEIRGASARLDQLNQAGDETVFNRTPRCEACRTNLCEWWIGTVLNSHGCEED